MYDVVLDARLMEPIHGIMNGYPVGFVGLMLCMSVYLARDFALTNKKVTEQEIQHRILEAENARQSKELEEARQLQISMLPKVVPELPHLKIAVHMKTATEVGGDYYDFHVGDDGVLTIAVGDATGHGARAGMMVMIAKSLFHQLSEKKNLCDIFEECTQSIKLLHLDRLYMAMLLVRISDHRMVAAIAGMPPIAIYRSGSRTVDQVILKGMPLGGFSRFPYRQEELDLVSGDAVVLMSDGLPETFNKDREMLEYSRLCEVLQLHGDLSPNEIVHHLIEAGEKWSRGTPQHDDITLVVVKVTG
jgi:serine phosphatase RsbU (regulator of sigma subunit)